MSLIEQQLSKDWQTSLLVLQATPFCNLNCSYCYLADRQDKSKMALPTLEKILQRFFKSGLAAENLTIIWHAGEPLAMPIEFYRSAVALYKCYAPPEIIVSNSIQTNAVLINQEWCDFFIQHDFRIGVSIDGPAFLHNQYRKTHKGGETHQAVMHGIQLLQKNNIDFHVIHVLSAESLDYADEIFEFYINNNIQHIAFNVEEQEGVHQTSSLLAACSRERYAAFMQRFLSLLKNAPEKLSVREFDETASRILSPLESQTFNQQSTPFAILSIDHLGNMSTFSPELLGQHCSSYNNFCFGNILSSEVTEILNNADFQHLYSEIKTGIAKCQENCQYFALCGGGAPANKFYEHDSFATDQTLFCQLTIQEMVDIVLNDMETTIENGSCSFVYSNVQSATMEPG